MRHLILTAAALSLASPALADETPSPSCPTGDDYTLAIHGGAGVILKENMSDKQEAKYRKSLNKALKLGGQMLEEGYSALDSIQFVVMALENDPKFNAGKGAVFSAAGINELDASIMDGRDRNAGAVSSVTTVKNPIVLARAVMDKSRHVMLQGEGAEKFAIAQNIEMVDPDYCGNLAAATSTGGLTAKEFGRVGDAPIIGAGTYADNNYCAVSATGTGEFFKGLFAAPRVYPYETQCCLAIMCGKIKDRYNDDDTLGPNGPLFWLRTFDPCFGRKEYGRQNGGGPQALE